MQNHTELNAKNVAFNIKKIREHKNYTQIYLAKKLAISQNAYSKIELGYSKITINRLFAIAQILDTDAITLITMDHRLVLI